MSTTPCPKCGEPSVYQAPETEHNGVALVAVGPDVWHCAIHGQWGYVGAARELCVEFPDGADAVHAQGPPCGPDGSIGSIPSWYVPIDYQETARGFLIWDMNADAEDCGEYSVVVLKEPVDFAAIRANLGPHLNFSFALIIGGCLMAESPDEAAAIFDEP